ncbi:MAG: NAD-dependent succinate-semialdehyde dehydrogenase [Limnochordales bacterium]
MAAPFDDGIYRPFVDGSWLEPEGRAIVEVLNPANGEPVSKVLIATPEDAGRAAEAAARAFQHWRRSAPAERAALLHRAAEILQSRLEDVARLLTQEQGKPLVDSRKELNTTVRLLHFYAAEAERIEGVYQQGSAGRTVSIAIREPIGPVAAIGPSNYPVELIAFKLGPALAAGCTAVVKPPEETPLSVLELIRCFVDAGTPPGVVNAVTGGPDVGEALVRHPDLRKVAFTGSTAVGKRIASIAGELLKPVTLELGGNSPFIVFADADLELAVAGAVRRSFSNAGQICIAVNRIFVERSIFDDFVEAFAHKTKSLVVANGLEVPDADMGPLVSRRAREHVERHVEDARRRGARVVTGGGALKGGDYDRGWFFAPTVLTNVTDDMLCMREETFGPVAPIRAFDKPEEAFAWANATPYGLAAYVYTRDVGRAMAAVRSIDAGGIGLNVNDVTELTMPFGGYKDSGLGRELGKYGLEGYLEWKHVRVGVIC